MSKRAKRDFRSKRKILPPDAFAYAVGPDLPPRDLIDEEVWNSIVNLPDDVSLRTSGDHGTELKHMHGLWASIINVVGNIEDVMWHSLLDVADELKASIVNSLHACIPKILKVSFVREFDVIPPEAIKGFHIWAARGNASHQPPSENDEIPWNHVFDRIQQIRGRTIINPEVLHKKWVEPTIKFCEGLLST